MSDAVGTYVSSGRSRPRDGWERGPWDSEDDRYEWRHGGYPCLAVRGPMGAWCGYVGLPPGHPWHGKDYDSVDDVEVHGGLTYSKDCHGLICHTPREGEPADVWWIGFDCAHCFDLVPGMEALLIKIGHQKQCTVLQEEDVYRDLAYVEREVNSLARQAKRKEEAR
jgi:hypothetical protein